MGRLGVLWRILTVVMLSVSGVSSLMLYTINRAGYSLLTGVAMLITAATLALYFFAEYRSRSQLKAHIAAQHETLSLLRDHIAYLEKRLHQTLGNRDREHDQ